MVFSDSDAESEEVIATPVELLLKPKSKASGNSKRKNKQNVNSKKSPVKSVQESDHSETEEEDENEDTEKGSQEVDKSAQEESEEEKNEAVSKKEKVDKKSTPKKGIRAAKLKAKSNSKKVETTPKKKRTSKENEKAEERDSSKAKKTKKETSIEVKVSVDHVLQKSKNVNGKSSVNWISFSSNVDGLYDVLNHTINVIKDEKKLYRILSEIEDEEEENENAMKLPTIHVIGNTSKRTFNLLFALASHANIVHVEWVYSSLSNEMWIPIEKYSISKNGNSVLMQTKSQNSEGNDEMDAFFARIQSVYEKIEKAKSLFDGLKIGAQLKKDKTSETFSYSQLDTLVQLCGGVFVKDVKESDVVLALESSKSNGKTQKSIKNKVSFDWLWDSIWHWNQLPMSSYKLD